MSENETKWKQPAPTAVCASGLLPPMFDAALTPFAPRSHRVTVLAPDGSEQEARLPPPEPEPETTEQRIAFLLSQADEAYQGSRRLHRRYYALAAEVDALRGDEFSARWHRALSVGDHDEAERCHLEDQARKVLAGGSTYGDLSESMKERIAAEVERLKAKQG